MTQYISATDYKELGERLITGLAWEVPSTKLRGDWLVSSEWTVEQRVSMPKTGLLRRFCNLSSSQNDAIHRFAKRYGPLRLCEQHRLPQGHPQLERCDARRVSGDMSTAESVDDWRRWARRFVGTLGMAGAIHGRRRIAAVDVRDALDGLSNWEGTAGRLSPPHVIAGVLIEPNGTETPEPLPDWQPPSVNEQFLHLARWLNFLMAISGVGRRVEKVARRHQLALLDGFSPACPLFGTLVLELVATCSDVRTVARCVHCGTAFTPAARTQRYCPKCRDPKVRWRRAQQRRRAALRAKGRTARGTPYKKKGQRKR